MNEQIEKIFGQINHNEKNKFYNPDITPKKLNENKVLNNNKEESIFPRLEKEDNSFYQDFMVKIKEDKKRNSKTIKKKRNNKIKPGSLKKEKSQANMYSKNFFDEKKEILTLFTSNNSSFSQSKCHSPNNKTRINYKKYSLFDNDKKTSKTTMKKDNEIKHVRSQNYVTFVNKLNANKKLSLNHLKNKNMFFENQKIIKTLNLEINNNIKKFNVLKIESNVNNTQIIKDVDFSNVKKINFDYNNEEINNNVDKENKENNFKNNKIVRYKMPNNILKKNSVLCCF